LASGFASSAVVEPAIASQATQHSADTIRVNAVFGFIFASSSCCFVNYLFM
jgi:hypothetical protein